MRTSLIFIAAVALFVRTSWAGPTTFEEYKQLSPNERRALYDNGKNPMFGWFAIWDWRLNMGEDRWQRRQLERLTEAHGYVTLEALFNYYEQLQKVYLGQDWDRRKASIPAASLNAEAAQWNKDYASKDSQYVEALRLFAALAPTPQAQTLNKQASDLLTVWTKQFPDGTPYTISKPQMEAMDQAVQAITEQLQKLPKLTPEEVQKAIERLPEDHMR